MNALLEFRRLVLLREGFYVRTKLGALLSVLGGFLIVAGLLAMFYAPGSLMKTPLDVDSTRSLSGVGELSGEELPVKAWSVTRSNSEQSDDDVVVFQNSSCLVKDEGGIEECVSDEDPQDRLLSATVDNFATDRVTALAVDDPDYLPAEAEDHQGALVNKWPFEAKQETYPYWDSVTRTAVDAEFDRVDEVEGLEVYVYSVSISDAPIEIVEGVPGTYDDDKEIWIEPLTGSIIHQIDSQARYDEDGEPVLALELEFTEEQVAANVADAKESRDSLNLVRETVPAVGLGAGIPLALIGLALTVFGRRQSEPTKH